MYLCSSVSVFLSSLVVRVRRWVFLCISHWGSKCGASAVFRGYVVVVKALCRAATMRKGSGSQWGERQDCAATGGRSASAVGCCYGGLCSTQRRFHNTCAAVRRLRIKMLICGRFGRAGRGGFLCATAGGLVCRAAVGLGVDACAVVCVFLCVL